MEHIKKKKLTKPNQSSDKLLRMIEALSEQETPVRLQDLAKATGMNASTALRFLSSLENNGYVSQEHDTGRYYLTYKLCSLANRITSSMSIGRICSGLLNNIALRYGESTNLAVEQDMQAVYILVINGRNQVLTTRQRIGNIAPMHCTGVGKLLLLNYSNEQMDRLIVERGLPRFTENTIITKEALLEEIEQVAKLGYAFDNEECEVGMRCVAAPVRDYTGRVVAGISVSGPSTRMIGEHFEAITQCLIETGISASQQLGYTNAKAIHLDALG